jgi:hypothetical protein
MSWFTRAFKSVKRAAKDAAGWTEQAAKDTADWTEQAAEDTVDWIEQAANDTGDWTQKAAGQVGHGFNDGVVAVGDGVVRAWEESADGALGVAAEVEKAGIAVGEGFLEGATVVGTVLEEAAEDTGRSLVELGEYVTEHACDIAVCSALTAAFAALAADGEEEAATGSLAALCALETVDNTALKTASVALAHCIVGPVYAIPDVRRALGHKKEVEAVIAILVFKACKQNPKMVVGTAGQFLAGVLIWGLTKVICEGKLPDGTRLWEGSQSLITG